MPLLRVFPDIRPFQGDARFASRRRLLDAAGTIFLERWHWFQYHFGRCPPTEFGRSLIDACTRLEDVRTGLGLEYLTAIARIAGRDRDWNDYDQINQKMAEILVVNAVTRMAWPSTPSIQIEEGAPGSRKRVDCVATTSGLRCGFEIKAPALLTHRQKQSQNLWQVPGRFTSREFIELLVDVGVDETATTVSGVTMPRDNPVYDFLVSANAKFASFKTQGPFLGILVIVWDDFIYEPITSLLHEHCGLLTENSYRQVAGAAETYPFIDAVILLRHMTYFRRAAGEDPIGDGRRDAFHIGGAGALPNVIVPVAGGREVPDFIKAGFNAVPYSGPEIEAAAEYRPMDAVMWIEHSSTARRAPVKSAPRRVDTDAESLRRLLASGVVSAPYRVIRDGQVRSAAESHTGNGASVNDGLGSPIVRKANI